MHDEWSVKPDYRGHRVILHRQDEVLSLFAYQTTGFENKEHATVCKGDATVLPSKRDRDVVFCVQSYQGLMIDKSLVYLSYPQEDRINTQVIYRFVSAQMGCTSYILLNNFTSLSLLVGTTVASYF